jgi:hypothetical protein
VTDEHFFRLFQRESVDFGVLTYRVYTEFTHHPTAFFHIDRSGNTCFLAKIGHWGGPLEEPLTVVVDEEKAFDFYTLRAAENENNGLGDWMFFKFSPEWDLLWYKQLVSHVTGVHLSNPAGQPNAYFHTVQGMSADEDDNLYVCGDLNLAAMHNTYSFPVRVYWDSAHHTVIPGSYATNQQSFLCKYDASGNVAWTKQLHHFNTGSFSASSFKHAIVKENGIYVFGRAADFHTDDPAIDIFIDEEMTIPVGRHNWQQTRSFFIKYDKQTGEYASHGFVPDQKRSDLTGTGAMINNHIVFSSGKGAGLDTCLITYFRDDGVLMGTEKITGTRHADDKNSGSVHVHESGKLFFHARTNSGLTVGGFTLPHTGSNSMAAFALMDDPSLSIPYDYNDTVPGHAAAFERDRRLLLYPNPAHSVINIRLEGVSGGFRKAELFSLDGQKLREHDSPAIPVGSLPRGIYLLKIYINDEVRVEKFAKTNP